MIRDTAAYAVALADVLTLRIPTPPPASDDRCCTGDQDG